MSTDEDRGRFIYTHPTIRGHGQGALLGEYFRLLLKVQERLFVVPRNHLALCDPFQMLEALSASKPGWVVSSQPALGDAVSPLFTDLLAPTRMEFPCDHGSVNTYIFDDVTVITDEEKSARLGHVNLHANEAIRVPRQMVQCDTLTKVKGLLIERLPVPGGY